MKTMAWFVSGSVHADMAQVSIASARKVDRHVCPVVMTDEPDLQIEGVEMVRVKPGMPLRKAIIEAQQAVLWERRTPVWFIDNDTLLTKPLPELWEEQIVLTWRDKIGGIADLYPREDKFTELMPYNGGLVGVMPGRETFEAFVWMRERLRRMQPDMHAWYGDQVVLSILGGTPPKEGESLERREIPWHLTEPSGTVLVRKIPCEIWNYTPMSADEDVSERAMLHFKHKNRYLMPVFAEKLGIEWIGGDPVTSYGKRITAEPSEAQA